ncbi:MAG: YfhO family protein [Muribaculaceae bacterium]|nr:YfhO family protein [Muribaculaceae bacterium]
MRKNVIYSVLTALCMAVLAVIFFAPDDLEGRVLQQHDMLQGTANGQEGIAFKEATGETTRWTDSLFGGMPNFQIAPSYPATDTLSWIGKAFSLWLPEPANLLFAMMFGFFIMCLCMRMKWYNALFASVAWGFSSYFIIIIGAGHIWKFVTLAYIPPTIGGLVLLYRGRYLSGTALAALFGALQLNGNHPQMTYYFLFVILAMVIAWLITAIKEKKAGEWGIATGCMIIAGLLAVAANSASLYNTLEYSKETVRGRATELKTENDETGGMDRSAITAWSYGVDETLTFLIPNVKGGATIKPVGGENKLLSVTDTPKASELNLSPEELQVMYQFPQYFGDQPMTNGPVYAGVVVLLLAIIALFIVQGPMKWALFAVSVLALMLSWGHNFSPLTDFFIDNFPGYNKFRAVSSFLVVVEFTIPLLAVMGIKKIIDTPDFMARNRSVLYVVGGVAAAICFIGWVAPSVFGDPFSAEEIDALSQQGVLTNPAYFNLINGIKQTRLSLVSADCGRSLLFILLGALVMWLYFKGVVKNRAVFVCMLTTVVLLDLFSVNKRYISSESFTAPVDNEQALNKTPIDEAILKDTAMNYRVFDVPGFSTARSSYFHKTLGGYHAAKLTRYNDLIDRQILKFNPEVINMLNTKYIITGDSIGYTKNPDANGNAWFVGKVFYVDSPDREMTTLDNIDTKASAVADKKFSKILGNSTTPAPGDTIYETSYAPNRLTYHARSAKGGVAVFSEIFFPWGWTATIDGKPAEIGRVNYVLRALKVPAGTHSIEFRFDPKSLKVTNTISMVAVVLIYILCAGALIFAGLHLKRKSGSGKDESHSLTDKQDGV